MKEITRELAQKAIECGWTVEEANRGWCITSCDYGNGATHVEMIDCMRVFESDEEAAKVAEESGVKIIHDIKLPEEHIASYIDTPENRELLKDLAL